MFAVNRSPDFPASSGGSRESAQEALAERLHARLRSHVNGAGLASVSESLAREMSAFAASRTSNPPSEAEDRTISAVLKTFGATEFCQKAGLRLIEDLAQARPSDADWKDLEDLFGKFQTLQPTQKRALVQISARFCGKDIGLRSWKVIFQQFAATPRSKDIVRRELTATDHWQSTDDPQSAVRAEAALFLTINHFALKNPEAHELTRTRRSPTSEGDKLRELLLLGILRQPPSPQLNRARAVLRLIEKLEGGFTSTRAQLEDALRCAESLGKDLDALWKFSLLCESTQTHELPRQLAMAAKLVRSGHQIAYMPFGVIEHFAFGAEKARGATSRDIEMVKRLSRGFSAFLKRLRSDGEPEGWVQDVTAIGGMIFRKPAFEAVLFDPRLSNKLALVLEGRNLPERFRLSSIEDLGKIVLELEVHRHALEYVFGADSGRRKAALTSAVSKEVGELSNPPFSLSADPQIKSAHMARQRRLLAHVYDDYYGFSADTFTHRHTPISKRCIFDECAAAVGGPVLALPAKDINRFPGRGRFVCGYSTERIFAGDPHASGNPLKEWAEDFLGYYMPDEEAKARGAAHPIYRLNSTIFGSVRGFRTIQPEDHKFFRIEGEHLSLIRYNYHFDTSGINYSYLVPTRVLWRFFQDQLVHFRPGRDPFPSPKSDYDVNSFPPVIGEIRRLCKELKTAVGVINLGWGANLNVGFCHAFDVGSAPFHTHETDGTAPIFRDRYGHLHTFSVRDKPEILKRLRFADRRVYEIAMNLFGRADMERLALGFFCSGFTFDRAREEWSEEGIPQDESAFAQGQLQADWFTEEIVPQFDLRDPNAQFDFKGDLSDQERSEREQATRERWEAQSLRMLRYIAEMSHEARQAALPPEHAPVLVLRHALKNSTAPISPFVVDSLSGTIWRRSGDPLFLDRSSPEPTAEAEEWWRAEVTPILVSNRWVTPTPVARDNYLGQMAEMGAA